MSVQALELLAPAGNRVFGEAAVNHGADAVYIGADRFSARSAAGNSVADIEKLAEYAHFYKARVYVALNTILLDHELEPARQLIHQLWDAGVDALIIQDLGLLEMDLPPIPLFASTQMDNRSVSRVRFLEQAGFERVILARELALRDIRRIRKHTSVDLEVFVHGALCVGYSGRCYFSAAIGGRSANRGECGQPCRLAWTLVNGDGRVLTQDRYLLSLKDMNRSDHLGLLAKAGVTSFKIEGRLKDMAYVKNITAFYRKKLDALMEGSIAGDEGPSRFRRASSGRTRLFFIPNPLKTFNRGETGYFLTDRDTEIHSLDTPKSLGEPVGLVDQVISAGFTLKTEHDLHPGDGLCFFNPSGHLEGFHVNRVDGYRIIPAGRTGQIPRGLVPGTRIFRNHDHVFLKQMAGESSRREIDLTLDFVETPDGFMLQGVDEDGHTASIRFPAEKIPARDPSAALATLEKQLGRLGGTRYALRSLARDTRPFFLTTGQVNRMRRQVLEALTRERLEGYVRQSAKPRGPMPSCPESRLDFTANVANRKAEAFYRKSGVRIIDPAFERVRPGTGAVVMTSRHCILKALGRCRKGSGELEGLKRDPLFIRNRNGCFQVEVDCERCETRIRIVE